MVTITYITGEKRFSLAYNYTTKRKAVRSANPKPKTFRSLATQVIRAQGRGKTTFSWQHTPDNPVLSLEGNAAEAYLYRYENGTPLTITSGSLLQVLQYLFMLSKNGTEYHRNAVKTLQININIA